MNKISKRIKKCVSLILAVVLVMSATLTHVSINVKAEAGNIAITSVFNSGTSDHWTFNLNISGEWPTTPTSLSEYKSSDSRVAIVKDKDGKTLYEGNKYSVTIHHNKDGGGNYFLLSVWGDYTTTNKPIEGDTVIIPAATLTYTEDSTKVVNLPNTTVLEYDGSEWKVCLDLDEMEVGSVDSFSQDNGDWRFFLNVKGTWPTNGELNRYYSSKTVVAAIKDETGRWNAEFESNNIEIYEHMGQMLVCLWGTYTGNNKPEEGDIVYIPECTLTYDNDKSKMVNFSAELKYTGGKWVVVGSDADVTPKPDTTNYKSVKFKSINVATNYRDGAGWLVYLNPDVTLPGTGDKTSFSGIKISIDGKESDVTITKTSHQGTALLVLDTDALPKKITKNTKVTLKAGKAKSDDGSDGIELKEDFVIYANQYGMSNTGFFKAPEYTNIKFKSISSATEYREGAGWLLYLNPDTELPGKGDSTMFSGVKVTVAGKTKEINVYKTTYENTAMFVLDSSVLPKNITSNIEIVIKAGKATSNDGSDGINITKDYTIYVNQYGMSDSGYCKKPSYKNVTFKTVNSATMYRDGDGWLVYIDPSIVLPGKEDGTRFEGIKAKIDGVETAVTIYKTSYANTALMVIPPSALAKKIEKNTKITVKAGKGTSNDGSDGIKLTKDFVIYANQYGLSASGYLKKPTYKNVTFGELDSATGYRKDSATWGFYLYPSTAMPGKGDSTWFKGLSGTVNGKKLDIDVYNSAHNNTAFIALSTDVIPADVTGKYKIVIKAGKATSNDGSNGIKLTKDTTIYLNKWGISTKGYLSKPKLVQKNAKLSLDRDTLFGGGKDGIYLNTNDKFAVDETWQTRISSPSYEKNSGVYYNGKKVDVSIIRYAKGKAFLGLVDAGITARDKDKVTITGVFASKGKAVSYSQVTYYFNGKIWNTKYEKAKGETYKSFEIKKTNQASSYVRDGKAWHVYLDTNKLLPGEGDKISFDKLTVEVNGKKSDVTVYHASYQDTLFFTIDDKILSGNASDGTAVTIKAGRALATDLSTGIELSKDYTFYVYKGRLTSTKPTNDTKYENVKLTGLNMTTGFREEAKDWLLYVKTAEELKAESGDLWQGLVVNVNGKDITIDAQQNDSNMLLVCIPESVLPKDAKTAKVTIKKGATAVANAGHDGIKISKDYTCYMFNGMFSDREFEKVEETEAKITGVQTVMNLRDVYVKLSSEFAGTPWYERYQMTYEYNGKQYTTEVCKADSSNNKTIYFKINETDIPELKEGDILKVLKGTVLTCGGYQTTITNDYYMKFTDGIWTAHKESDIKAPEDTKSLWEIARFDDAYIPLVDKIETGSIMSSNEDEFNSIKSIEKMKDYTVSFNVKKMYDDETTPSFSVILRGNAVDEEEPMSKSMLYGYVITFSSLEKEAADEDEDSTWMGYIQLWKNGENYALLDQYRIHYMLDESDHPFFKYDKNYNYTFSIYNITETCVCIEAKVNGKLALRYYDEAGSDPFDPAINEGTFQIDVGCPSYFKDDIVELGEVISEADECEIGDEVRVSATYPSVLDGAVYTVDKEGAKVEDGIFVAETEGTYTVSGTYNGKELTAKTIKVVKSEAKITSESKEESSIPVIPIVVGGIVVVLFIGGVIAVFVYKKRKNK